MLKNCPSCGRPIIFEEKYARILACGYCSSILEFGEEELVKIGEQGEFIEFPSIFVVGKEVLWEGKKVYVKGVLRYIYDGGFFDKFFVIIKGEEFYINEDDGKITLLKQQDWIESNLTLIDKPVGETIEILNKEFFVQETGLFELEAIKGYINTSLIPGKKYEYLVGIVDSKLIFIEKIIGENKIRFAGEIK